MTSRQDDSVALRERLPPLPRPQKECWLGHQLFSAEQMHAYAVAYAASLSPQGSEPAPAALEGVAVAGSLTYAEQRKVVEHMTTELGSAIGLLQSVLQRAEAIDCQPLAAPAPAQQAATESLTDEQVEWVVNDNAELGVKIGQQFFFCYKGRSLVYKSSQHDDGTPMHWRPVLKREFGECVHPVNYADLRLCGHMHRIGTVSLDDSDEWQPLPQPPTAQAARGGSDD